MTVSSTASPTDVNFQYEVADATGDADRYVWGNATISIQDVPDPVSSVRTTEFGDHYLKVSWVPGQFNNSPITEYDLAMTSASSGALISTTDLHDDGRMPGHDPGQRPGQRRALLRGGRERHRPLDAERQPRADLVGHHSAAARRPQLDPLDAGLRVGWRKPADAGGSAIEQYVVIVGGVKQVVPVSVSDPVGTQYFTNIQAPGAIANGAAVGFSVSARNSAPNSLATWNEADGSGIPAGPPLVAAQPDRRPARPRMAPRRASPGRAHSPPTARRSPTTTCRSTPARRRTAA